MILSASVSAFPLELRWARLRRAADFPFALRLLQAPSIALSSEFQRGFS